VLPAHLVLANAGGGAGQYKVAEAWEAALQQGISLDHLAAIYSPCTQLATPALTPSAPVGVGNMAGGSSGSLPAGVHGSGLSSNSFGGSAAPSQGAVPPLVSLRRVLLPYIRAEAERLVLQGPLRDLEPQEPTGSQNVSSKAPAASADSARKPSPQKPAEPREPPPWKTRSPGAVGAGGIEGGPMSPVSSSEDRRPNLSHNLLSPRTLPASATLSLSPSAAGGLSLSPKLHTLNLGASGAGGAGGGEDGGESLEWQDATYLETLHTLPARPHVLSEIASKQGVYMHKSSQGQESPSPTAAAAAAAAAAAKDGDGVLQTRDTWGDFQEGGTHVIAAGSAGRIEVKEEEWGDFDEGVDEALAFPSGALPFFLLNPKLFPQLCPACLHAPASSACQRAVGALLAQGDGRA
jgi:hypothetical protein